LIENLILFFRAQIFAPAERLIIVWPTSIFCFREYIAD